jgi:hypothetical protein
MKTLRLPLITFALLAVLYGCAPKYGCPANARNTGAENAENIKHPPKFKGGI